MYMFAPIKVAADLNSQVLGAGDSLKGLLVEGVGGNGRRPFVGDRQHVALLNVEAHLPSGFPLLQGVQVLLKAGGVSRGADRLVQNGIICKEAHDCRDVVAKVIDIDEEEARAEDRSLGDARYHSAKGRHLSLHKDLLGAVGQEAADPGKGLAADAIVLQLQQKTLMGDPVKSFAEVEQDGVGLSSVVDLCCKVVHREDQLGLARSAFTEAMLCVSNDAVPFQVSCEFGAYDVF